MENHHFKLSLADEQLINGWIEGKSVQARARILPHANSREHKRKCKYNGQMNIELTTTETGPVTEGGIENHHAYPVGAHAIGKGLEGKRKGEVGTKKTQILERN